YCSPKCSNLRQRKLTAEMLRPYAERGTRLKIIRFELGVCHTVVCRSLRQYGLHSLWWSNRKCVSRKAGHTSATTASATASGLSAASAARTVGATNYGS